MATVSPARTRIGGAILLSLGAVLGAIGLYLVHVALNWTLPPWLPDDLTMVPQGPPQALTALADTPIGLAAAYVAGFGGLAVLNALWMLVFGRRNGVLVALLILMFLIFVVVGVWATLDNGHRLGQIGG